jgi:hypothetical protein
MGAMPRQVGHQKAKNSTNCNPPDARVYVLGSVASRFGPREVATICGTSAGDSVEGASIEGTSVEVASGWAIVAVGAFSTGAGISGWFGSGVVAGAQPTNTMTVSKLNVKIERSLIVFLSLFLKAFY